MTGPVQAETTDRCVQAESTREKLGAEEEYFRKQPIISKKTRRRTNGGEEELQERQAGSGKTCGCSAERRAQPRVNGRLQAVRPQLESTALNWN